MKFFSPAAFEQRSRDRARRRLRDELIAIERDRQYNDSREPVLLEQLRKLNQSDLDADLSTGRAMRVLSTVEQPVIDPAPFLARVVIIAFAVATGIALWLR